MSHHLCDLPDIALNASTVNATTNLILGFEDADVVTIFAPLQLTGTCTVMIAPEASTATASVTLRALTSGGSPVTIAEQRSVTITDVAFRALGIMTSGSEATSRTFKVVKQILVR